MSTPTSPLDARHPLSNVESASQRDDGASSYQSTDTVRRRPEQQSYGTLAVEMHFTFKHSTCLAHNPVIHRLTLFF